MSVNKAKVVIIGAPAAGKSKIAKRVARLLDVPRIDTDKVIVAERGPIVDIFDAEGEPAFRAYERQAVKDAIAQDVVVSVGGGAILNEDTQHDLRQLPVVLLTVTEDVVEKRFGDPKRPLLRHGMPAWRKLVEERTPIYTSLADLTIDTSHTPFDEVAERVAQWIRDGYPGRKTAK